MAEITIQQAIDLASEHHKAGRIAEAESVFRQMQGAVNNSPDAMVGLGTRAFEMGLRETAMQLFRRALELQPDRAEAHNGLAVLLRAEGKMQESLASFQRAAQCNPNHVEYLYNIASMLRLLGRPVEAIEQLQQVLPRSPDLFAAHYEMARARQDLGQITEAIETFQKAIVLEPNFSPAHHHLGVALALERRIEEAIEAFRRATALDPKNATILFNLGHALHDVKQYEAAIDAYEKSIQLQPADPRPQLGIGNILVDLDRREEAIAYFQRAIQLHPPFMAAYSNLASALEKLGRADEAISIFRYVIKNDPNESTFHSNLLFALHFSDTVNPEDILTESQQWAARHAEPLKKLIPNHGNDRSPDRELRIGYLSADLREHPVGMFLLPILTKHDRKNFHVTCYCNSWTEDDVTKRLQAASAGWHVTPDWSDDRLAQQIADDGIDILVDLSQHTAGNRLLLFARKPAPVQITYLGHPGTTGLTTFDARIGDPYLDPPGMTEQFFSEPIERMPRSYWSFQAIQNAPRVAQLPAKKVGSVTFGCLNKLAKSSPSAIRTWAAILNRVPQSRLLMSAPPGDHRQRILDLFKTEGVESSRIELMASQPFLDYLALYDLIDIGLDPFPFNGGTTTCQAMWMGVPVITLAGKAGPQRSGVSLLTNAGVPELIASTQDHYIDLAVNLAGDLPRLSSLRSTMRKRVQASPLMNLPQFVSDIEAIYRKLWRQWCEK